MKLKPLSWICGLSLAANLALIAHVAGFLPNPAPDRAQAANTPARPAASASKTDSAPPAPPPPGADAPAFTRADTPLAKILDGGDYKAMRDALEASGLTEADAKALIRSRLRESQKAAREAIDRRPNPQEANWWYQDDEARQKFDEQRRADRRALDDQLTQTLASLFGPEAKPAAEPKIHNQARFLPESKRLAVSRILEDYEAMQREARPRGYHGASLPSDDEKRRFIDEERRRDLAEVLSPEELRAYDMRHSNTAQQLRWSLGAMKPTLEEYEAIFAARHEIDSRFDTRHDGDRPADFWDKRREAEQASLAKLRATLGEERFIDYALSNDHQSRQVTLAAERYGLAPDTTRRLWKLRQDAGREGKAIYDDPKLDRDQKRARISELAERSRRQVDGLLNPEARAELKNNGYIQWVDNLSRHQITIYNELGNGSSGFGL